MSKALDLMQERVEDTLDDLEENVIALPARFFAGWRRSRELHRMPQERDVRDHGLKRHHDRRHAG